MKQEQVKSEKTIHYIIQHVKYFLKAANGNKKLELLKYFIPLIYMLNTVA